jgi:hypothetical protein
LAASDRQDAQGIRATSQPDIPSNHSRASLMSSEEKLIDLSAEREKRIHDIKEKRLAEMRQAFEEALPLAKPKKKAKTKPKKR